MPTPTLRRVKDTEFVSGKSDPSNPSKWFQTGIYNLKSPVRADTPTQLIHGQPSRIGIRVLEPRFGTTIRTADNSKLTFRMTIHELWDFGLHYAVTQDLS